MNNRREMFRLDHVIGSTFHPGHMIGDACIADPLAKFSFAANGAAEMCAAAIAATFSGMNIGDAFFVTLLQSDRAQLRHIARGGMPPEREKDQVGCGSGWRQHQ